MEPVNAQTLLEWANHIEATAAQNRGQASETNYEDRAIETYPISLLRLIVQNCSLRLLKKLVVFDSRASIRPAELDHFGVPGAELWGTPLTQAFG